ncbi:AMPKBI domain-containing protein [Rhizoctonia solani AG-1 IA]|uniref:AMPKBI domain-containing protein n=1 Tax=Thanatephorus cucumeris (strain AG1-IA) TaxID=983506 RepID=L8WPN2_THACA|nr:AMPKBI domain-containing protein [Rhizoctonia solani AG-1 IA]
MGVSAYTMSILHALIRSSPTSHSHVTTLDLRPGTYRLKFIVDDQWKCSDSLPTAVDDAGNLVNYIEVAETDGVLGWEKGLTSAPGTTDFARTWAPIDTRTDHLPPWTSEIPPLLSDAVKKEEEYLAQRGQPNAPSPPLIPHPPALPRHLEKVILNARTTGNASAASGVGKPTVASMGGVGAAGGADDNSVLPVPNHVVLNHLGTSAIKGGVLAVGTTTRYHRKVSLLPLLVLRVLIACLVYYYDLLQTRLMIHLDSKILPSIGDLIDALMFIKTLELLARDTAGTLISFCGRIVVGWNLAGLGICVPKLGRFQDLGCEGDERGGGGEGDKRRHDVCGGVLRASQSPPLRWNVRLKSAPLPPCRTDAGHMLEMHVARGPGREHVLDRMYKASGITGI